MCSIFSSLLVTNVFADVEKKVKSKVEKAIVFLQGAQLFSSGDFFIPAGTIHSSGKNTLTLEIDMFCFTTFKLWDWGRLDYDGKPRPINIDHGKHDGLRHYHAANQTGGSGDDFHYLLAGDGIRLNGISMGLRQMRHVQP